MKLQYVSGAVAVAFAFAMFVYKRQQQQKWNTTAKGAWIRFHSFLFVFFLSRKARKKGFPLCVECTYVCYCEKNSRRNSTPPPFHANLICPINGYVPLRFSTTYSTYQQYVPGTNRKPEEPPPQPPVFLRTGGSHREKRPPRKVTPADFWTPPR